jgi:endonuclease/exonuclease/phosphatase family metal-dependent hydrolase
VRTVRLLTFNTLFRGNVRARLRLLGELLAESAYDIVCLQEVMFRRHARLLRRAAPAYRHQAYAGAVVLEGGLVILSRWPITRWRFVRYPLTRPLRPEMLMRKGAQLTSVASPDGELIVVNTHLSANRHGNWSRDNASVRTQRAELHHLTGELAALDAAARVVLTGDLNVPRESAVLQDFIAAAGLRDVLAGDQRPTYRPTPEFPAPPAFDHVLIRGGLAGSADLVLQNAATLPTGRSIHLSDHYGISADLSMPSPTADR